jgi:hypothetical protein
VKKIYTGMLPWNTKKLLKFLITPTIFWLKQRDTSCKFTSSQSVEIIFHFYEFLESKK